MTGPPIDPLDPSSRWRLERRIVIDQVQFCDGVSEMTGVLPCVDEFIVESIREAP